MEKYFVKKIEDKLMLCSRDIQVGDKVRSFAEPTVEDILNPQMQTSHKFSGPDAYSFFKVIGEVSPEAIWVKEGDEFDKEEVELSLIDDNGYWLKGFSLEDKSNQWFNPPTYCKAYIQIKCPTCKTFH